MTERNETGAGNGAEKYRINYGSGVVVLPKKAADRLASATKKETAVLLAVLTNPEADAEQIAGLCRLSAGDADAALAFWRGAGVIELTEAPPHGEPTDGAALPEGEATRAQEPHTAADEPAPAGDGAEKKPKSIPARPSTDLPQYTMEETADMLEKNAAFSLMIDECGRILGKVLSVGETASLLALIGQLDLSEDFVLLTCAHCAKVGKKSVRYVCKTAVEYFDRGITSTETLEEHIRTIEKYADVETELRKMLGIGQRELGSREKKFFETWLGQYGYSAEAIRIAFDIAVDNNVEKPLPYMNGIIEKWHGAGLQTPEEIRAAIEKQKADAAAAKEKTDRADPGKSFDSGDFFAQALQRSYQNSTQVPEVPKDSGKVRPKTPKR